MAIYPDYLPFTEDTDYEAVWITVQMMYSDILNQGDGCCKPKGVDDILCKVDGFLRDIQINTEGQPNANELRWESSIQQAYLLLMGFFRLSANPDVRPTLRYITYTNSTTSSFTFSNEEPHLAGTSGIQEFYTPRTIKITMTDDIAYKVNGVEYDNENPYTFELTQDVSVNIESGVVPVNQLNLTTDLPGFLGFIMVAIDGQPATAYTPGMEYLNSVVFTLPALPVYMDRLCLVVGSDKVVSDYPNHQLILNNSSPVFGASSILLTENNISATALDFTGGVNNTAMPNSFATLQIAGIVSGTFNLDVGGIISETQYAPTPFKIPIINNKLIIFFQKGGSITSYNATVTINGVNYTFDVNTEYQLFIPISTTIHLTNWTINSYTP